MAHSRNQLQADFGPKPGPMEYKPEVSLSFEDWEADLTGFLIRQNSLPWKLGACLAYGEEHFGEQFSQALPEEGYALKSLKNYIWVHERVPLHVRRPELSWSHHQVIAKCDQALQVQWLERCVKGGWSLKEFRQQVKGQAKVKAAVPPPEPQPNLNEAIEWSADRIGQVWRCEDQTKLRSLLKPNWREWN